DHGTQLAVRIFDTTTASIDIARDSGAVGLTLRAKKHAERGGENRITHPTAIFSQLHAGVDEANARARNYGMALDRYAIWQRAAIGGSKCDGERASKPVVPL